MKNKLVILLATYNSQNFLREQLESLYNQTEKEWDLYIRDDGSTDDTFKIVKEFKNRYSNIILLEDSNFGLGAMKSFLTLLENVHADYYMFCDHDDVWLPNKVELSLKKIIQTELENVGKPIIVHSDLKVVNDSLQLINSSFWEMSAIKPNLLENKKLIQVFNCVTGCTMIFNVKVKHLAFPYIDQAPMHDWWLALQTLRSDGIIKHIDTATILYRQHGNNEVGARSITFNYFVKKIIRLKKTVQGHAKQINFLKQIKGLNAVQYYYYKIFYTILRNL